mgnify:FL=1
MLESKVFANGSTTLPQPVREALGVKAGDTVHFVSSKKGVQIVKAQSVTETTDVLARSGQS